MALLAYNLVKSHDWLKIKSYDITVVCLSEVT